MNRRLVFLFGLLCIGMSGAAQQVIRLYANNIPNSLPAPQQEYTDSYGNVRKVSVPDITAYFPSKPDSSRAAVIICSGGGYGALVINKEGHPTAQALAREGLACFVLKYRLPDVQTMTDPTIGPIQDLQQAIKMVRDSAGRWGLNPHCIGVLGFSAGGHLAATAGTHFNHTYIPNSSGTSLRPDFMMLLNPVISMRDSVGHSGSRANLLGVNLSAHQIQAFSNELHVTANTPPVFLMHAADDHMVSINNSLVFYHALLLHKVAVDAHFYARGDHGFPLEPAKSTWMSYCLSWLRGMKIIGTSIISSQPIPAFSPIQ